jgi:hypothetical protein
MRWLGALLSMLIFNILYQLTGKFGALFLSHAHNDLVFRPFAL